MDSTPLTFEQLPALVVALGKKVDDLTTLLRSQSGQNQSALDRWLSIEELSDYLPGHPAVTTLYGKVQRREIPYSRSGKRLVFLQSDIDQWLQNGRVKTSAELDIQANHFIANRSRGGRKAS